MNRMMMCAAATLAIVLVGQSADAQNRYGIQLKPGERLIAVDGVPVNQFQNGYYSNNAATSQVVQATAVQPAAKPAASAAAKKPAATGAKKPAASKPLTADAKATAKPISKPAPSMYSGSDQERAQAEANYMAANGIRGHVGGQIGRFEGCGWSTGGTPNTCTPSYGMTLTADATAYGPGGVYRVRAWR